MIHKFTNVDLEQLRLNVEAGKLSSSSEIIVSLREYLTQDSALLNEATVSSIVNLLGTVGDKGDIPLLKELRRKVDWSYAQETILWVLCIELDDWSYLSEIIDYVESDPESEDEDVLKSASITLIGYYLHRHHNKIIFLRLLNAFNVQNNSKYNLKLYKALLTASGLSHIEISQLKLIRADASAGGRPELNERFKMYLK